MKKRADGRYCKQIRINGKIKSFYGKSEREINRKILAYQDTKEKGEIFKTVAEEWLDEYLLNTPYTTFKKCGKSAYLSLLQEFGNERIKNITSHDVDIFLKRLAAKDYAQKTVATYKSIFNQIFRFAIVNGYTNINPVTSVSLPKNLKKSIRKMPDTKECLLKLG